MIKIKKLMNNHYIIKQERNYQLDLYICYFSFSNGRSQNPSDFILF